MKKALSLMLALVLAFGVLVSVPFAEAPFSIIANAAGVEDLTFTLNSDGASYTLSGCKTTASGDLTVPAEYEGLPVTAIATKAFYNCNKLESITIPEGVTTLADSVFSGCTALVSVSVPNSVTSMGSWVFYNCHKLRSMVLPEGVTSVPHCTFYACNDMASVVIKGDIKSISTNAFGYCESLKAIEIPDSVTTIGDSAFRYSGITSIRIPKGVTAIKKSVFEFCSDLETISIPAGVTTIGNKAFYSCENMDKVYFSGSSALWSEVTLGTYNTCLTNAQTHFEVPAEEINTHYTKEIITPATCLTDGEVLYTCPCGHDYKEVVSAYGHEYTAEWTVENSTCVEEGTRYHYCTRCGDKKDVQILSLDSEAHSYGDWIVTDATCEVAGEKHKECELCGAVAEETVLPATGHSFGEFIIDKEATCEEDGAKHKECAICGAEAAAEAIPATGHIASEWITVSETEKQKKCTACGVVLETEIIETEVIKNLKAPKVKELKNEIDGISFEWNEIEGAKGYIVYRRVIGGKWQKLGEVTECSYVDENVKSGAIYIYAVKAYNGNVKSSYRSSAPIKFLEAPVINECTGAKSGNYISWDKVKGANGYVVYRKTAESGWVNLGMVKGTSFIDRRVKGSEEYYYTVKACSGSTRSAYREGTPVASLCAPVLKAAKASEKGIEISWNKVDGAEKYTVYRKTDGSGWKKVGITSKTSYVDKSAKKGVEYTYTVVANGKLDNSDYDKDGVSAKIPAPESNKPGKPHKPHGKGF